MITPSPNFVSTDLGRLNVRRTGTGPPVVLWHSLFVDSRSWGPLVDMLAVTARCTQSMVHRMAGASRYRAISRSRSASPPRIRPWIASASTEPVDWVGNAWGGHIGIHLAAASARLRTLTTIGTPVQGFTFGEKLTKGWPLVEMYRFTGPNDFIMKQLFESLLGAESIAAQPDKAETIKASFR